MLTLDLTPAQACRPFPERGSARALGLRETKESARRELVAQVIAEYRDYLAAVARRKNLQQSRRVSAEVLSSYSRLFVAGKRAGWMSRTLLGTHAGRNRTFRRQRTHCILAEPLTGLPRRLRLV